MYEVWRARRSAASRFAVSTARRDDAAFFSAAISAAVESPAHALRTEPAVNMAKRRQIGRNDFLIKGVGAGRGLAARRATRPWIAARGFALGLLRLRRSRRGDNSGLANYSWLGWRIIVSFRLGGRAFLFRRVVIVALLANGGRRPRFLPFFLSVRGLFR